MNFLFFAMIIFSGALGTLQDSNFEVPGKIFVFLCEFFFKCNFLLEIRFNFLNFIIISIFVLFILEFRAIPEPRLSCSLPWVGGAACWSHCVGHHYKSGECVNNVCTCRN